MSGSKVWTTNQNIRAGNSNVYTGIKSVQYEVSVLNNPAVTLVNFDLPNDRTYYTIEFLFGANNEQIPFDYQVNFQNALWDWFKFEVFGGGTTLRAFVTCRQGILADAALIVKNHCAPVEFSGSSSNLDPRVDCILFWLRWAIGEECYKTQIRASLETVSRIKEGPPPGEIISLFSDVKRWKSTTRATPSRHGRPLWGTLPRTRLSRPERIGTTSSRRRPLTTRWSRPGRS